MIRPSRYDRPDGWLQRIFLEAIARVRLWPDWKKRSMQAMENRCTGVTWRGCNSGNDPLDIEEVRDRRPSPLECCGKIPSECTCLEEDRQRGIAAHANDAGTL